MAKKLILGVNLDHVATLRQARYALMPNNFMAEPNLEQAVQAALAGGAQSLTLHLREDRRHIQDTDVLNARNLTLPLNLEMGIHPTIIDIALKLKPASVCLVPEKRQEITTEGGLDVAASLPTLQPIIQKFKANGTRVSLFIDPELTQIEAAAKSQADMIELHTGPFALVRGAARAAEVSRLTTASLAAHTYGLQVNAGHGLTIDNLQDLFSVPHLRELNIGHHIISRALFIGLKNAVAEIRHIMNHYPNSPS